MATATTRQRASAPQRCSLQPHAAAARSGYAACVLLPWRYTACILVLRHGSLHQLDAACCITAACIRVL